MQNIFENVLALVVGFGGKLIKSFTTVPPLPPEFWKRLFCRVCGGDSKEKSHLKYMPGTEKTEHSSSFRIGYFLFSYLDSVCFTDAQPEPQDSVLWGLGKNSPTSKIRLGNTQTLLAKFVLVSFGRTKYMILSGDIN